MQIAMKRMNEKSSARAAGRDGSKIFDNWKKNYDRKILEVSSLLIVFKLINSIYIPIDGMDTHAGVSDKQPGKVKMAKDSDSGKVANTNTSF